MALSMSVSSLAGTAVSARRVAPRAAARSAVAVTAAARPMWYPSATAPKYLDGSLPGDYGFDPLKLGATSASLPWYAEAERQNGRWAMAAVAGILTTELIGAGGNWWSPDASAHVANGAPTARVFAEAAIMAVAESFRLKAFDANGPASKAFDPAGMNSEEARLKEVKNGRLAMVAFLGFTSQAAVRGLGPIACLKAHLADPGHVNIFTSSVGGEACAAVVALSIAPMFLAAQKNLKAADDKEEFRPIPW